VISSEFAFVYAFYILKPFILCFFCQINGWFNSALLLHFVLCRRGKSKSTHSSSAWTTRKPASICGSVP